MNTTTSANALPKTSAETSQFLRDKFEQTNLKQYFKIQAVLTHDWAEHKLELYTNVMKTDSGENRYCFIVQDRDLKTFYVSLPKAGSSYLKFSTAFQMDGKTLFVRENMQVNKLKVLSCERIDTPDREK
jgi:hypothetical protein